MSASLIGRQGSSAFQTNHYHGVDVARGLVLLFGIGTKALPVWASKTRRNNLCGGLAVLQTVGPTNAARLRPISSRCRLKFVSDLPGESIARSCRRPHV